jgi:hypothetical protein
VNGESNKTATVPIRHFRIELRTLRTLTKDELRLLLWSMVALNDLNVLHASIVLSMPGPGEVDSIGLARHNQTLFFRTLAAGKLYEVWDAFRRDFADAECFTSRLRRLPNASQRHYELLKAYFGAKKNPIRMMRNWVAFHYGTELRKALDALPDDAVLNAWFDDSVGNARFDAGSEVTARKMNEEFSVPGGDAGIERFMKDTLRVLGWVVSILTDLVGYLMHPLLSDQKPLQVDAPASRPQGYAPFADIAALKKWVGDRVIGDDD